MDLNRKIQPALHLIDKLNFPSVQKSKLANGIDLYSINAGEEEIVKVEFVFNAGKWQQHKKVVSYLTASMLKQGTSAITQRQISDQLDFYGASVKCESGTDDLRVEVYTLSKFVEPVFKIVHDILMDPIFPQKELDIMLRNQKQKLMVNKKKVEYVARGKFLSSLYGENHPYGYDVVEEDYDAILQQDIRAHYAQYIHGGNCFAIASGKLPANFTDSLNNFFGNKEWIKGATTPNGAAAVSPIGSSKQFIDMEDAAQSAIRIGRILFDKTHPDFHGVRILNVIFGGYFGSRLMTNIREDKGYTYGIYSGLNSMMHSGYMMIGTEVGVDVTEAARDEIYKEMVRLINEPVPDSELTTVRNYLSGSMLSAFDGVFNVSSALGNLIPWGLDFNFIHAQFDKLKTITADEIQSMAKKYYQPDSYTEVIAGAVKQEVK